MKNLLPILILPVLILSACVGTTSHPGINEDIDVTTQTPVESTGTEAPLV